MARDAQGQVNHVSKRGNVELDQAVSMFAEGKGVKEIEATLNYVKPHEKLTNWKKEPSLTSLLQDFENSAMEQEEYVGKLDKWGDLLDGGAIIDKKPLRSNYRDKLVRKQAEWRYPLVEEPILNTPKMFKVLGTAGDIVKNENIHQELLNYQWNNLIGKQKLVNTASRNFVNEGTAIIKLGWDFEYKEIEERVERPLFADTDEEIKAALIEISRTSQEPLTDELIVDIYKKKKFITIGTTEEKETRLEIVKNQPKFTVVDNDSIYFDIESGGDITKCRYIIEELEVSFSDLKKNEVREITYTSSDGKIHKKLVGHYKNLDSVKVYLNNKIKRKESAKNADATQIAKAVSSLDELKQKILIYEYWGYHDIDDNGILVPIVATWVGDTIIRLEENPYAHREFPYSVAQFMPVNKSVRGEPDAELTKSNQEAISSTIRGIQDIVTRGAIGQTFVNEDLFYDTVQKDNFKKGRTVWVKGFVDVDKAIHRTKPDDIPPAMMQFIDMQKKDAEQLTGVIPYESAIQGGAKHSDVTGNKRDDDASTQREMGILRRFLAMIQDLGRKTLLLNQEYITDETVIRVTGSAKGFRVINSEDLTGKFLVDVNISTPQKNDGIANKLLHMMQTNAANMSPKLANLHYIKLAELWNQDDLADSIREDMNAPPDPMEQKMQELQIQSAELDIKTKQMELLLSTTKIAVMGHELSERALRLEENKETANVEYIKAQARKLQMQSALFQQELEYIQSGLKIKEDRLRDEYQHAANLEREEVRTRREIELNNESHKQALERDKQNTETMDHAVHGSKTVMNNTLYGKTADGSKAKWDNIKDNNQLDLLEEVETALGTDSINKQ